MRCNFRRSHSAHAMDASAMMPRGTPTPAPMAASWLLPLFVVEFADDGDALVVALHAESVLFVDEEVELALT